ncbi:GGDEF domain-containing protein [Uliginosibacterium sp. H3]|uniref:diguanylate cyclase n=1 Tax=Uliginosibacterium silvisoli TaxID=3114758 RepID=A0ABU6K884_9RHOO|nr:GGDEF domain-containing protein [Uliginosibacterium sp. H3]
MRSETALLHLLKKLQSLEASRDRQAIAESVVVAALEILNARSAILHGVKPTPHGLVSIPVAWAIRGGISSTTDLDNADIDDNLIAADPLLEDCAASPGGIASAKEDDHLRLAFSISQSNTTVAIFESLCDEPPSDAIFECVRELLSIYAEHLVLLDYAELDTLTRLHNRKTFDENFDRFIAIAEQARRRSTDEPITAEGLAAKHCWLGVIDIDKFKRINDNFGHLFGDEVLLRVAEVMKKSFRASDKLFRFGGEEFIVLLRFVTAENAHLVFDRFRQAVEHHEFPQVGQVTCSMGYIQIDPSLAPAEILGRADEALYFCKENGRNQINRYETLVQTGLIQGPVVPVANEDLQADIDALFD